MRTLGFLILNALVVVVNGGECCKEYVDTYGDYHAEAYCTNYCCGKEYLFIRILQNNDLECCENSARQVEPSKRESMCSLWWSNNAWAPATIALGSVAVIGLTVFLVYKFAYKAGDKVMPANTPRIQAQPHRSPSATFNVQSTPSGPMPQSYQPPNYIQLSQTNGHPTPSFNQTQTGSQPPQSYRHVQPPGQPTPSFPHTQPTQSFNATRNTLLPPIGGAAGPSGAAPGPSVAVPGTSAYPGMVEQPPSYEQSINTHNPQWDGIPQKKW